MFMNTMAVPLPSEVAAEALLSAFGVVGVGVVGVARPRHCDGREMAEVALRYEDVRRVVREESWWVALRSAMMLEALCRIIYEADV